jgi:tetratricopeptide (TPR) repeat protein
MLAGYHGSGNWIDVGIYGSGPAGGEPGLAVPFDSRVLVFEVPGSIETRQAANLAHEIGHVLGAWNTPAADSVMSLPPGAKLDAATASCLRLTRTVDLLEGASSLDDESVKRFEELWAAAKDQPANNPFYRFYSSRGAEELNRGLRYPAEEDFTKALAFAPGLLKAHVDLGSAELASRDFIEATEELRRALALDPGSNAAMSALGAALVASGHRDEGLEALVKSVKLNPGDSRAHANVGTVLVGMPGRLDDGIAELKEALRIDPTSAVIQRTLDLALAAKKQGRK